MAALSLLAQDRPWRVAIIPASAMLRRVPPQHYVRAQVRRVEPLEEVERDDLVLKLLELGFLRVPLVEDPGTFSARGAVLDVFPPNCAEPRRIEFDDNLVATIHGFDTDT